MGQKGAHTCDIIFENCRVHKDNIIGLKEGQGFKTAMKVLDRGRLHISAVCVGVAERLIKDSLNYALERKQFGKPIAEHQLIQAMLADSKTEAYAARTMVLDAARKKDAGHNVSMEAACCKLFCAEMVGGVAERLIKDSLNYALERKQFGKPIAEHQLIQAMLADSKTEAYAARTMVLDAARKKDAGHNVSMEAACCKLFCAEMVGRVADRAVQIYGGAGYIADYGIERFYRDVRLFRIYEGTTQIQQTVVARNMIREAQQG